MSQIDDMTEEEIDAEIKRLHEISRSGKMTPKQAIRLGQLRNGFRTINSSKRSVYWL